MAYCTKAQVKTYLGISEATDDDLIDDLIDRAQKAIETYTDRIFKVGSDSTRYFTVGVDTVERTLFFDEDLCQITSIVTNADDGSGGTTLETTDYHTKPRNETPYYAVKLASSSSESWDYTDDPEDGITVTGWWGYSVTPPADIVHACIRLASYYYRQKDAQIFDVTAMPSAGVMTVPQGMPKDVKVVLDPYRRLV
jgi:hypothetical protein